MTTAREKLRIIGCFVVASCLVAGCASSNSSRKSENEASLDQELAEETKAAANGESSSSEEIDPDLVSEELDVDASSSQPEDQALNDADLEMSLDDSNQDLSNQAAASPNESEVKEEPKIEAAPEIADLSEPEVSVEPTENSASVSQTGSGSIDLTDLKYVSKKEGGTVVVQTSGPATFRTREVPEQNQVIVEISNANLPSRLKRPYLTREFGQAITAVQAYQESGSSTARVVIQLRDSSSASVSQDGNLLLISPSGKSMTANEATLAGPGEGFGDEDAEFSDVARGGRSGSGKRIDGVSILPESSEDIAAESMRFYGKPVSIEVNKSSIRDVLNLIAEQSGANIVLSSEVDGDISLKLRQVPWDQALMIVLKTKGLGYIRQGSVLRVAPSKVLQEEAEEARKTLEALRAAEPLKVKIIAVSYASVDDMATRVKPFLTPSRGQVAADPRTGSLILTDLPEVLERAENLIKSLDTPPMQVLIEGKVVEASEQFSREFGVRWGFTGREINLGGDLALQRNNLTISPGGVKTGSPFGYNLRLGTLDVLGDLDAALSLAERETEVRIVSSPRVVTMNNKEANISQETNIFIPTPQPTVGGATPLLTYEKERIPLSLKVKPQITNGGDVIMEVNLTRSFVGVRTDGIPPDVNQRAATTNVMVRNGQTAVIGGVYQSDVSETENGVPWLRKIPILGWLFKSKTFSSEKNELLLFLTPRILGQGNSDNSAKEAQL